MGLIPARHRRVIRDYAAASALASFCEGAGAAGVCAGAGGFVADDGAGAGGGVTFAAASFAGSSPGLTDVSTFRTGAAGAGTLDGRGGGAACGFAEEGAGEGET